jgi:nucleotide-binding universal stress UspA family protein
MGTIVVGIDGSETALAALRWAVGEARLRGDRVLVVHAWQLPTSVYGAGPYSAVVDYGELERGMGEQAQHVLDNALAAIDSTGVDVERRIVRGNPASSIVDAASGAQLIVVGSRGRGGFAGLLLGSVSSAVAHHASCPVVIVRPPTTEKQGAD